MSAGYGGDGHEEGRPAAGALHGGAAGVAAGAAGGHGGRCTRLAGRTKAGRLKSLLCLDWGGQAARKFGSVGLVYVTAGWLIRTERGVCACRLPPIRQNI